MIPFKYLVMADGGALCFKCSLACHKEIQFATQHPEYKNKQWQVIGVDINLSDKELICDHCYEKIEAMFPNGELSSNSITDENRPWKYSDEKGSKFY